MRAPVSGSHPWETSHQSVLSPLHPQTILLFVAILILNIPVCHNAQLPSPKWQEGLLGGHLGLEETLFWLSSITHV